MKRLGISMVTSTVSSSTPFLYLMVRGHIRLDNIAVPAEQEQHTMLLVVAAGT